MLNYFSSYLRSVDENLIVSEDYMSLSVLPNTSSDTLFDYVKQILLQLNLPLEDCRGKTNTGFVVSIISL